MERAGRPPVAAAGIALARIPGDLPAHDLRQRYAAAQLVDKSGRERHGGNIGAAPRLGKGCRVPRSGTREVIRHIDPRLGPGGRVAGRAETISVTAARRAGGAVEDADALAARGVDGDDGQPAAAEGDGARRVSPAGRRDLRRQRRRRARARRGG